jgi:hypothetical protein
LSSYTTCEIRRVAVKMEDTAEAEMVPPSIVMATSRRLTLRQRLKLSRVPQELST